MTCPQCGYLNGPSEPVCAQCGTWLPIADAGGAVDPSGLGDGIAERMVGGIGGEEQDTSWVSQQPIAATALDPPPASPAVANPSPYSPYSSSGSSGSFHPSGSFGTGGTDTSSIAGYPQSPQAVITRPANTGDARVGSTALESQPFNMGILLKGGRYRLVQPYSAASGAPASQTEPPLMIASDSEVPNTRVLIQELPFGNLNPQDADHARQVLTQRLIALSHVQGLAHLVDSFSEHRRHFLVFELPTGDLLSDRLRRAGGRLGQSTAVSTALRVLDVLEELDREFPPVTHGNLCPAHVILRPGGRVSLVGMSPTLLLFPDGQVLNGPAAGMPGFAAPEQSRGQASPRVDLYAVCAVLYAAVTGATPAIRSTALYQPARHINPEVSLELEAILSQGLRPSPSQRYQSAADLRADLAALAAGLRTRRLSEELLGADEPVRALLPLRDERGRFVVPRQPMVQNPLFLAACVVALIIAVGSGVLFALHPRSSTIGVQPGAAARSEAAQLFMTRGIGLSGGEYVFDADRPDNGLKQAAERAVAAGDLAGGMQLYQQALKQDPADAEAAIYVADLQILQSGRPYVTMVAAVAFGAGPAGEESTDARTELQGVSLAQQRINAAGLLPHDIQLLVLILNSNKQSGDATSAAHLLLAEVRAGNTSHLIGLVGWPESDQNRLAILELASSDLAIVSPTASADGLGADSSTFFSLVPPDSVQAGELADAAHAMNAHRVVVVADPTDQISAAMAAAFADRTRTQYSDAMTVVRYVTFTAGSPGGLDTVVGDAVAANADLIYLAGGADDAIHLALAVQQRLGPGNNRLHILVGPQADTPALLGLGDSATAGLARGAAGALSALYVATLATPGAWDAVQAGVAAGARFADTYTKTFGQSAGPDKSHSPNATVMLSYDATNLLTAAARPALGMNKTQPANAALAALDLAAIRARLHGFDEAHPFIGVGGATWFATADALPRKALAILRFERNASGQQQQSVALVVGGKALFCGPSACQLTL